MRTTRSLKYLPWPDLWVASVHGKRGAIHVQGRTLAEAKRGLRRELRFRRRCRKLARAIAALFGGGEKKS